MTPAELTSLIRRPDADKGDHDNRRIRPDHARSFAKYFIEQEQWVIPGIILRAPSIFEFDQERDAPNIQFGVMSFAKRNQNDIQILDGQHRVLGFHVAMEQVTEMLSKARDALAAARRVDPGGAAEKQAREEMARLDRVLGRFDSERVAVEIQVTDDPEAYKRMFVDIAENALGITASVKARFDSRKVQNRALPEIFEHPLLKDRVDLEADRLTRKSRYLLTARHALEIARVVMVGYDGRFGPRVQKELTEQQIARANLDFWDDMVLAFDSLKAVELENLVPDELRDRSMLGSPFFLRVLAGVYWSLIREHVWNRSEVVTFFATLAPHMAAPAHVHSIWKRHAPPEAFTEGAWAPNQRRQDAKGLVDRIAEWAIDGAPFVVAGPEPAPLA